MSRPIASVHLDIARFLIEIQDAQANGGDAALGLWTRNLARSLALNDPEISTFGAHLLAEAQKYRDAEKERKKPKHDADSGGKTRNDADSSLRKKERKKESKTEDSSATRKPDPIWDVIVEIFFADGVMQSESSRVGKVVRDLKSVGATPDQIKTRFANMRRTDWGRIAGPEGMIKQWANLRGESQAPIGFQPPKTGTVAGSYPLDQEDYSA